MTEVPRPIPVAAVRARPVTEVPRLVLQGAAAKVRPVTELPRLVLQAAAAAAPASVQ